MAGLLSNFTEMARLFTDVATATANPIPALMLLFGAVFVGFSVLFFAYLTVGGLGSALISDVPGRTPPQ
ncbi:hypothetical protein [Haladaptatus sp. DYF46]|uniref:hypothetical protein n=1 Tax=Haladaptatus sp. DYF46 TaxID=2886041 RepID=UPI001E29CE14|nr:hypothetical protein [Haladaptatus sp. DYF46]